MPTFFLVDSGSAEGDGLKQHVAVRQMCNVRRKFALQCENVFKQLPCLQQNECIRFIAVEVHDT